MAAAPVEKRRGVASRMGNPLGRSNESLRMGVRDMASAMAERPTKEGVAGVELRSAMMAGDQETTSIEKRAQEYCPGTKSEITPGISNRRWKRRIVEGLAGVYDGDRRDIVDSKQRSNAACLLSHVSA